MIENILITHGYSDSNKGDLAITYSTYRLLRKKYPRARIVLHSTFRISDLILFKYHNRFMLRSNLTIKQGILPSPYLSENKSFLIDLVAVFRLIKEIIQLKISLLNNSLAKLFGGEQFNALLDYKKADIIIVKGGQYIYNDNEDIRGNLFLWRTLQPLDIAKRLNKKAIILGQSFGGFKSERSEQVAIKYLTNCHKIFVREKESYNFLRKYNLGDISSLLPDMAFYLNSGTLTENNNLNLKIESHRFFGVTLVNWIFPESEEKQIAKENYITSIVEACIYLYKNHNLVPLFIPQVIVRHHGQGDSDIINIVVTRLKDESIEYKHLIDDFSVIELMNIYKQCEFLIGTRLHSCILAANVGTPILPIRYQGYKTQGVAETLGQRNLLLDIHTISPKDIINNIKYILKRKEEIKKNLLKQTNLFRQRIDNIKVI